MPFVCFPKSKPQQDFHGTAGPLFEETGRCPEPGVSVYDLNLTLQALHHRDHRALKVLGLEVKESVSFYWPI